MSFIVSFRRVNWRKPDVFIMKITTAPVSVLQRDFIFFFTLPTNRFGTQDV